MPKRKYPKGESPWHPCFFRASDRESICSLCEETIPSGSVIFFFPKLGRYKVFCYKCFQKKIETMRVVLSL